MQHALILTLALIINAQTHSTSHLLTFFRLIIAIFQRTYLEHIRIVPPFFQRRVREDKSCRLIK